VLETDYEILKTLLIWLSIKVNSRSYFLQELVIIKKDLDGCPETNYLKPV